MNSVMAKCGHYVPAVGSPGSDARRWTEQMCSACQERLATIYQEAYDECAGPPQFRHSVNHDVYHMAGLLAVTASFRDALKLIADHGDTGTNGRPAFHDMRAQARLALEGK